MRTDAILWTAIAAYYAIIGTIYGLLSGDPAGTTVLLIGAPFGGLVAGSLWHTQSTHPDLAADRADADAADETGIVGTYTTDSIRPFALAVGFVGMLLGLVIGLWMTGAALALVASQIALVVRDADQ